MKIFLKEVISSIKNIGAIAPSSRFLAKNILSDIHFEDTQIILEFGTGNGAITKHILERLPENSRLISLEINEQFYKHCQVKFKDYENNSGGKTSFDDLNGKYTYIDVWATWCGPCIAEIPSLKKVEKEFHGKNIEFVSISIDREKDHEKWKKMIVDRSLGGMQLFADKNWESQFIQDYMIKGIPRFILIDPQGNIVNSNAPRPSDKKLVKTLKSLNL